MRQTVTIPPAEIDRQLALCDQIHTLLEDHPGQKLAFVDTYGCQQNEADSERLRGYLARMGYALFRHGRGGRPGPARTPAPCGNTRSSGSLATWAPCPTPKRRHPGQIICVCGCMARQEQVVERLKTVLSAMWTWSSARMLLWQFPGAAAEKA